MSEKIDSGRRGIIAATATVGACAGVAAAVPFVGSMLPSERAKALGAPVETDISALAPGEMRILEWRGKPVWVLRRTPEMMAAITKSDSLVADPKSEVDQQPEYAVNEYRSREQHKEVAVLVGVCTHLGCSPQFKATAASEMGTSWPGGFYCACHGSKYDFAGRVYKGVPAPKNLQVPPYEFLSDNTILIGEDKTKGA
jgi:ubiquinol-cytochrome c reductase iron-sulfur subunit